MSAGIIAASAVIAGGAVVSDSFNRADSSTTLGTTDTGQTWFPLAGTWGITSNTAYKVTPSAQGYAVCESGLADCTISVKISGTVNAGGGITFRSASTANANNLFFFDCASPSALYIVLSGSMSLLTNVTMTPAAGDVISIVLSGTSIIINQNGVQRLSTTDTRHTTNTKHGLRDYTGTIRLDDFSVT